MLIIVQSMYPLPIHHTFLCLVDTQDYQLMLSLVYQNPTVEIILASLDME